MMKKFFLIISLIGIAALVIPKGFVRGQAKDDFVITNADATNTIGMTGSGELTSLIQLVSDRFVVQYANGMRFYNIVPAPVELVSLISSVAERFVIQYANANRFYNLVPAPTALVDIIDQVADRFIIQYANANKFYGFTYPVELINDTFPPQISGIQGSISSHTSIQLLWTTDEYTTSQVIYGTEPGVLNMSSSSDSLTKDHLLILTGLTPGMTCYYRILATDRSGNTAQSDEMSVTIAPLYLPLIQR